MDPYIDKYIRKCYPNESNKIISWNIVDPYIGSINDYKKCVNTIKTSILDFIAEQK